MIPSSRQLETLIRLCESSDASHREEILPLLTDPEVASGLGARIDVHDVASCTDLAGTYRVRAQHLTRLEETGTLTDPSQSGRRLPATLAEDVRTLAARLTAAGDQPVQIWSINLADRTTFVIFVLVRDELIAGVVKSVTQVTPQRPPSSSSDNL